MMPLFVCWVNFIVYFNFQDVNCDVSKDRSKQSDYRNDLHEERKKNMWYDMMRKYTNVWCVGSVVNSPGSNSDDGTAGENVT